MKNDETIVVKKKHLDRIVDCVHRINGSLSKLKEIQKKELNDFEIGFIVGDVKEEITTIATEIHYIIDATIDGEELGTEPLYYAIELVADRRDALKHISKELNDINKGFYLGITHQMLNESVGILKEYDKRK
ncbi:hypothetical protein [Riemerella anatipestifer]|uniref:hypothetical protein n=1 Tax=Riemerella anatipestifer TaxID=34085 RepID=UPI0021F8DF2F|nr:hypothetical protein [Riemerella anatipestifer]MCW0518272.1 hypothetical protein [Riemerella anatipestifer]